MKLSFLAATAVLTLLAVSVERPALAGTTACVHARTQIGDGVVDNVSQHCQFNINGTVQAGNGARTRVDQVGGTNSSTSRQFGDGNRAVVRQRSF